MRLGNWFLSFCVCCRYHSCQRAGSGVSGGDREKRQILAPPQRSLHTAERTVTRESCMPFLWRDKTITKRSVYVTSCAFHMRFGGNKAPFREYIFWFINARDPELLPFGGFYINFIFFDHIVSLRTNKQKCMQPDERSHIRICMAFTG